MAQRTRQSAQVMPAAINILPYRESHRKKVLNLIASSDSTPRTSETWNHRTMTAVLAFDHSKLIGVIPFEKRKFCIGSNQVLDVLWISAAHVDPKYRGRGIGTAMDKKIPEFFPNFDAVFAFRPDETSRAYRWYQKLGFVKVLKIRSFKKTVSESKARVNYEIFKSEKDISKQASGMLTCFRAFFGKSGGSPVRSKLFWTDRMRHYYYKDAYNFSLLTLKREGKLNAYAFLGRTSMRDRIDRFDILDWAVSGSVKENKALWNSIFDFAARTKVKEVRIQLGSDDPQIRFIQKLGFKERWQTNMIARFLDSVGYFKKVVLKQKKSWRYFQIDYA